MVAAVAAEVAEAAAEIAVAAAAALVEEHGCSGSGNGGGLRKVVRAWNHTSRMI
jgi:hypothetical protein